MRLSLSLGQKVKGLRSRVDRSDPMTLKGMKKLVTIKLFGASAGRLIVSLKPMSLSQ